jgi:hypothetical protein
VRTKTWYQTLLRNCCIGSTASLFTFLKFILILSSHLRLCPTLYLLFMSIGWACYVAHKEKMNNYKILAWTPIWKVPRGRSQPTQEDIFKVYVK